MLYNKCMKYIETMEEIFEYQKIDSNFIGDYRYKMQEITPNGKGGDMLDTIIKLNLAIDIENLKSLGNITKAQRYLYDLYIEICTGTKTVENVTNLTNEERTCLKKIQVIPKPLTDITIPSDLETEFFKLILKSN